VVNSDDESAVQTMSPSAEVLNIQTGYEEIHNLLLRFGNDTRYRQL